MEENSNQYHIKKESNKKSMIKNTPKKNELSHSTVPDFIQKLFRMLDNEAFRDIFCWNSTGNTFIVKDTNEFSKTILPKHFKHCNFASFVRQLNKYDFHKIRSNTDDNQKYHGGQMWEFEHAYFKRDRLDLLEAIKRKTPGSKKRTKGDPVKTEYDSESENNQLSLETAENSHDSVTMETVDDLRALVKSLQSEINELKQSHSELESAVELMNKKDEQTMTEFMEFQATLKAKDELIKQCLKLTQPNNDTTEEKSSMSMPNDTHKHSKIVNWRTPPRVLLVDDDSLYRDMSGRMLSLYGCEIDYAKDGLEALLKIKIKKYDLILMDIIMPNMNGIATTRQIRTYDSNTPIVSMTSNFTNNDIMEYIGIGMNDILPKPFSKNTLYEILEKHCAHLKLTYASPTQYPSSLSPISTNTPSTSYSSSTTSPTNTEHYWTDNNKKLVWSSSTHYKRQKHDLY